MSRWWRAYDEAVDDPKLLMLSDKTHRGWFNLLCVASIYGGALPGLDVVTVKLRSTPAKVKALIEELIVAGLIDDVGGKLIPHNWNSRQYKSDVSTDRVKRFRNGKRNVSETPPETETETDKKVVEDTRARLVSDDALSLAAEIGKLCGYADAVDWPLGWSGAVMRVQTWLNSGWPRDQILAACTDAMARKRDGPPRSINYFDGVIASFIAKQAQPLPQGQTQEARHAKPTQRSAVIAEIDNHIERFRAAENDGGGGTREAPPRLLSHG